MYIFLYAKTHTPKIYMYMFSRNINVLERENLIGYTYIHTYLYQSLLTNRPLQSN